ncbi:acyl-CoA carboxylase subunit beta [Oceanobacillus manasiensis]|uniref:acyl-CoA carboxylase subunit beta n=1 Tax=Oceanobacillus manasiensis TaxID=586413 RepID=UPI0005A72E07|nr:acyl-CoA carboxylase subunit beta [Oceanobacillus manasiensis]
MSIFKYIKELANKREEVEAGGGEEQTSKQHVKGKWTARERLNYLLDEGSFVEIQPFLTERKNTENKVSLNGDGVVGGYGKINGKPVCVYAQDFTVYGGSLGEMQGKKIASILDLAGKNRFPFIGLIDSGGARIQEGVSSLDSYGHIFYRNVLYSGIIPQISVIMGPSAGGAVYSPALTDFIVMVEKTSQMFVTGPKVMQEVTGVQINPEELGGSAVHSQKSGNAHIVKATESEALDAVKDLLMFFPPDHNPEKVVISPPDKTDERPKLLELVPADSKTAYDIRRIIEQIVDIDSFIEIHEKFAKNVVVGFAKLKGSTVGLVCNQPKYRAGGLDIDASDKIARFIRFCDCFHISIITLEDVTGFLPGVRQEHEGIIRHGAKIVYAYAEATVPKITVILRKAYGGAYVALNSKALGADMVFAWPQAEIAVMGPEGAVSILNNEEIKIGSNPQEAREEMIKAYREKHANPYTAAALGMVDDVIFPDQTRIKLIQSLEIMYNKQEERPKKKHGNIPL